MRWPVLVGLDSKFISEAVVLNIQHGVSICLFWVNGGLYLLGFVLL
jgi:hypothetical protein